MRPILDPPIWSLVLCKGDEQQRHDNLDFNTMMTLLVVPLGPALNRSAPVVFEVYRGKTLKARLQVNGLEQTGGGS